MIRRLLHRPYALAEPWLRDDKWLVRRTAQAAVMSVAAIWLMLPRGEDEEDQDLALERSDEFVQQLSSSARLREFLHGPAIVKPLVGRICRVLLLRLSGRRKSARARPFRRPRFPVAPGWADRPNGFEEPPDLAESRSPRAAASG